MKNVFAFSYREFKNLPIDFSNTAIIEIVGKNDVENSFVYNSDNVCRIIADDVDGGRWISQNNLDILFDKFINNRMNYDNNKFIHNDIVALDYQEAEKVVKFIDEAMNDSKIDNIFIHCSAGQSRSQAIVRYIKDIYYYINTRDDNPCLTPNMWIVMMLKRVYRIINY